MKKYPYNYLGICITNQDPEYRGRVKIFIPNIMPALYANWTKEHADITLECVGDNLATGLKSDIVQRLEKILPWAECASPIIGSSVAGQYSNPSAGGTGTFNQNTNGPGSSTGGTQAANFSGSRAEAFAKMKAAAAAAGSPDPNITASIAMLESGWLQSSMTGRANNPFGQTITQRQIGTNGIIGGTRGADGQLHAVYDSLESAVAHHVSKWGKYYTPGNINSTTNSLVGASYNIAEPRWGSWIQGIYGKYNGVAASSVPSVNINDPTSPPDTGAIGSVTVPFNSPDGNQTYVVPPDPGQPSVATQGTQGTLSSGITDPTSTGTGSSGGGAPASVTINRVPPAAGSGGITTGTMTLTLPNGQARTYQFNNGGFGAGAIPAGSYTISNGRQRNTKGMVVDGVGYSFDLSDKYDPNAGRNRSLLRIHPDGGATGTMGCLGIIGGADVQRQFYNDMSSVLAANGGRYSTNIVDNLPGTGLPGASTPGSTPVPDQPTTMVQHPTPTQASPIDTTGMAQGMFVYPNPGALLWVFFREGDPLFPVYFAASYGQKEWASAYQASPGAAPLYYPSAQDDPFRITNKTVMRFNAAGAIEANGSVTEEQDLRTLTLAHANGAHLQFHPSGSIHYTPNEHLEQVGGNKYSYRLNNESWTQGIDNKVVLGNQFIKVGNPSQENLATIEEIQAKITEVNQVMLQE